jgi:hypothetical protein
MLYASAACLWVDKFTIYGQLIVKFFNVTILFFVGRKRIGSFKFADDPALRLIGAWSGICCCPEARIQARRSSCLLPA